MCVNTPLCFVLDNKENCNDSILVSQYKAMFSINLEIYRLLPDYLMVVQPSNISDNKKVKAQENVNNIKKSNALECIFSKGDLMPSESYKRFVMSLELVNDSQLLSEYKDIHSKDRIWPQIIDNMNTIGIHNMFIYIFNYKAFLIMDTKLCFDLEKEGERWACLPREQEWQAYVSKFQKVNPESNATEKWQIMTPLT